MYMLRIFLLNGYQKYDYVRRDIRHDKIKTKEKELDGIATLLITVFCVIRASRALANSYLMMAY